MSHTLRVLYFTANGRSMGMISWEAPVLFVHIWKKTQTKPSWVFKYIPKCEIKLHLFYSRCFLKSYFILRVSFDIGHTSGFSKQSCGIMYTTNLTNSKVLYKVVDSSLVDVHVFCTHLECNLVNNYWCKKCSEQKLWRKLKHSLFSHFLRVICFLDN